MAYTDPWDGTDPPGSTLANRIDDKIRLLRNQLKERLESALIVDMEGDPWVPKVAINGAQAGKIIIVPAYEFNTPTYDDAFGAALVPPNNARYRASIILPNGIRIRKVRWLLHNLDTFAVTCMLRSQSYQVGTTPALDNTQTKSTVGAELISSGALNIVVDATRWWWLEVIKPSGTANTRVFAVEVTYDTPDARNTL